MDFTLILVDTGTILSMVASNIRTFQLKERLYEFENNQKGQIIPKCKMVVKMRRISGQYFFCALAQPVGLP